MSDLQATVERGAISIDRRYTWALRFAGITVRIGLGHMGKLRMEDLANSINDALAAANNREVERRREAEAALERCVASLREISSSSRPASLTAR